MSDDEHKTTEDLEAPGMPGWQKTLLALAAVLMVVGGALQIVAWVSGGEEAPPPEQVTGGEGADSALVQGFAPGGAPAGTTGETPPPEPSELDKWSPTIFRLGFSFFVGFALGYVFRTFMKISVFAIGLLLLLLFGLQYGGIIDVDWARIETIYEHAVDWIQAETASFTQFVRGYVPSAASAAAGLVVGFKRR